MTNEILRRAIPSTGELIPAVGLGTWQTFDARPSAYARLTEVLSRFHAGGGTVVDASPMYGRAETVVGELAGDLEIRAELFLATKVWTEGKKRGVAQMEESLRRFGVSRVDLMQVHNLVDVEAHLDTLAAWKREGKVRYVGITHYTESAFPALEKLLLRHQPDFVQFNYSIAERAAEKRLLPLAAERGTAVIVNRPFGTGGLFDRVRGRQLPQFARELGCRTWGQFFLKYILGHPAVTCVIPATADAAHVEENLDASTGSMPDEAMRRRMADEFAR